MNLLLSNGINLAHLALVVTSVVVFLSAGLIAFASRRCRGSRRVTLRLVGIWLFFPTLIASVFVLLASASDPTFETALAVVSIVVSFFFGVFGSPTAMINAQPLTVAVLFASKKAFFREVRSGLQEQLISRAVRVVDLGSDATASREDEIGFLRLVRRTAHLRPDYAVIWAPGYTWSQDGELLEFVEDVYREGGLCIFLENAPPPEVQLKSFTIQHNASMGGKLLGLLALQCGVKEGAKTLVLLGPEHSDPAKGRNGDVKKELEGFDNVSFLQLFNWNEEDVIELLRSKCIADQEYKLVLCPNDGIALALEDAARNGIGMDWLLSVKVLGFDGLPRVRACVAEAATIIHGTVSIPPSEYGARAGRTIGQLMKPSFRPSSRVNQLCGMFTLPMNEKHIITRGRARLQLYDD